MSIEEADDLVPEDDNDDDLPEGEDAEPEDVDGPDDGDGGDEEPPKETVEDRARRMGWRPKDEWRGPTDQWRDAEAFVKTAEENIPVLRDTLRRLESRLADQERRSKRADDWQAKMQERANVEALERLKSEMSAAVEAGDTEAFQNIQQRLDDHIKERTKPAERQEEQTAVAPETQAWVDANPWFNEDQGLHDAAVAINKTVANEYPGLSLQEQLEETKKRVMSAFPDNKWFRRPEGQQQRPRRQRQDVEGAGGGGGSVKSNGKGWRDLPQEARSAYDEMKDMFGKDDKGNYKLSKEEYAKDYFAEEGGQR